MNFVLIVFDFIYLQVTFIIAIIVFEIPFEWIFITINIQSSRENINSNSNTSIPRLISEQNFFKRSYFILS